MSKPNVFRKGSAAIPQASGGKFVKVTPENAVVLAPMVEIDDLISVEQHEIWDVKPALLFPCIGAECPACQRDLDTKFKAFLPVLVKNGPEFEQRIYAFGISVVRQWETMADELGGIRGKIFKVVRTGRGFQTKYTIMPLGKETDKVDEFTAIDPTEVVEVLDKETISLKLDGIFGELDEEAAAAAPAADDDESDWGE